MGKCPFCSLDLSENQSTCPLCGYPQVLALPYLPGTGSKWLYVFLATISILLGSFSFFLTYRSFIFLSLLSVVFSLVFAGICLEGTSHRLNGTLIKYLAIAGLILGISGYLFSIFFNSHVPSCGYTM
jgi:hypothetical protein